ncbi:uncharacterized protein LOC112344812 [Selaginella moellendorffii]|nr:uncharacterized protein LOC112344812 [Selaginella moellendorffii]|eukprot:XP_024525968.1 uncharacterized protein LOC112344812 [Selaginella moellendorffii]
MAAAEEAPAPVDRFDLNSKRVQDAFEDWGSKTTIGIVAGMIFGGLKEGRASAHWQPFLPSQAGSSTWNERQRVWRNVWEQRFVRVAGGTVSGGAKLGFFTSMYCGLQHALAIYRDVDDAFNTAIAASATAATLGLVLPGSLRWRLRTSSLGIVLGAVAGLPIGYIQTSLNKKAEELMKNAPSPSS